MVWITVIAMGSIIENSRVAIDTIKRTFNAQYQRAS